MKDYITWKERSLYGNLIKECIDLDISPGIIIGKGGKTIQEIENFTHAKVRVLREDNKILISGYKQDYVNSAINEISKIIENYKKRFDDKYNNNFYNNNNNNNNNYEIEKEPEKLNFLDSDFPPIQAGSSVAINPKSAWNKKPDIFKS